jgi:hypothetical protein
MRRIFRKSAVESGEGRGRAAQPSREARLAAALGAAPGEARGSTQVLEEVATSDEVAEQLEAGVRQALPGASDEAVQRVVELAAALPLEIFQAKNLWGMQVR